jgi:two-component system chemotaxis response regulator CheY
MSQTVLVVDDSPTVVKFVSLSLKSGGFKVISAGDGMEALETVSNLSEPIDMMITDLNMPNMDGFTLIETIRQNGDYQHTPIIILSSEEADSERERGLSAGANSYLIKPFRSSVLLNEVSKYLKITKITA